MLHTLLPSTFRSICSGLPEKSRPGEADKRNTEGLKAQGRNPLFMGRERDLSELKCSGLGSWQGCMHKSDIPASGNTVAIIWCREPVFLQKPGMSMLRYGIVKYLYLVLKSDIRMCC